ncbi:Gibberellin 2-beta-dioxygenase 2 [Apostasia shenzhenica]|uniref:gibberellin 2beta-dioxygenase n=1 Tax=Apostasia shenzhenica TaxID=1088818 RepID=A0A2I0A7L6_9ASPA|nr:Gibberellin 2-beta-dioxygenase 2 [Apostasia shenzhenica]
MVVATLTPEGNERILAADLPVVDLSWSREKVRKLVVRACEEYGFFKVISHGVPEDVVELAEKESVGFFSLPASEKKKAGPPNPLGYGSKQIGFNGDSGDLEYLLLHASHCSIYHRVRALSMKDPHTLSYALSDYVQVVKELACDLLEIIAEGLGLEDRRSFSKLIRDSESDSLIRINHYPSPFNNDIDHHHHHHNNKSSAESRVGFGEHSDPQILTILRSNDVEGLQIQPPMDSSVWVPVKSDPSAFFINVGDALQVMTNGRFVSVRHRAIANAQRSRLSTIFFAAPPLQTCVSPLPLMVTHNNPPRYKSYLWAEYKKLMYSLQLASNRLELFQTDCRRDELDLKII